LKYHIQIPETMSDDECAGLVNMYEEKIAKAELVILDFKLVNKIESSGLLRIHKICRKINPNCDFKIVNAKPMIYMLLKVTPLGKYLGGFGT